MFSSSCARTSYVDIKAICIGAPLISGSGLRRVVQWLAVMLGAASLAACTQAILPPIKPKWSRQAARRPSNTIEPYRSRQRGAWRSQESTRLSHRTKKQPRHRSHRMGLPASTRKEQRPRPREVQHARTNGRPSHVALRHPAARNERRQRAVRDGPRQ